ncbi:MAG: hypothetical protein NXH89_01955 [Cyclobacteriaceae bacterium]|uniref:Uncharacterized protein n=1 Tax=Algoriphagus marincola TaxID=264027 RepID=A0ABS7N2S5_9BACT|nr:hypothetical protein [Algoriphagus marincola]MBY5950624.1 hypothetical protein [Algoriphagus marincola]MCR9081157.1 hypothetical protein [Cyclobacteriaceae bacterium]
MRKFLAVILFTFVGLQVQAIQPESKTFLVIFQSQELKQHKIALNQIEEQFSSFDTKSYEGNSELALFIEIPSCDFDECFLGDFLVEVSGKKSLKLEDIAFRVYDLTKNESVFENFLSEQTQIKESKAKGRKLLTEL